MADRSSSSISSSDSSEFAPHCEPGLTKRRVLAASVLALIGLVIIDVAIARLFRMPASPNTMPTALQQYFDYGRSVEGKLRRMIGPTDDDTAPVARAGWLNDQTRGTRAPSAGKIHIAVYGQSFAEHMVESVQAMDNRFEIVAERSGPAAPLSHSYAAYRADSAKPLADIAIIGVLASALPKVLSLTNMTASFEAPAPFTYPRVRLENGSLVTVEPRVRTLSDLRRALHEPAAWDAFVAQLRADDLAFDSLLFEADMFDQSSLARLARRSYGQYRLKRLAERYHRQSGFINKDGLLDVSKAILGDIARIARERGQLAYIVLIHDRGYGNDLVTALGAFLEEKKIPYLSTHVLGPPTDTRTFVADGHFKSDINEKLAEALRDDLLAKWLPGRGASVERMFSR
jgi:hypothetical protein